MSGAFLNGYCMVVDLFLARDEGRNRMAIAHGDTPDIIPSRIGR